MESLFSSPQMDNLHKEEMIMERIRIDIENLRLGM